MPFVYHGVPRDMVGDVLHPLNQLAAVEPELHEFQKSKYAGREVALDFRIPGLDVLLGDALHCAAVHPYRVFQARQAAGIETTVGKPGSWMTGMFFAIPLERILRHRVVWYSARRCGSTALRMRTSRTWRPRTSSSRLTQHGIESFPTCPTRTLRTCGE